MTSLKTVIIDDEPKLRKVLQIKLEQYCPDIEIVETGGSMQEGYEKIIKTTPDLVFLDISMPGGSGFDLLDKFDTINFEVIFVTGFNDNVLDVLKISSIKYLLKPVITADLITAVQMAIVSKMSDNKVLKYQTLKHNLKHLGDQETKIVIPNNLDYYFVKLSQVIRLESLQNHTRIHIKGETPITSSLNIGVYKDMLTDYNFYGTDNFDLVNYNRITRYLCDGFVVMSDLTEIPVSKRRSKHLIEKILKTTEGQ